MRACCLELSYLESVSGQCRAAQRSRARPACRNPPQPAATRLALHSPLPLPSWALAPPARSLFKGVSPLWGRQIPYTMMKFGERARFVLCGGGGLLPGGACVWVEGCYPGALGAAP